mgnify:CR=1 FL=1
MGKRSKVISWLKQNKYPIPSWGSSVPLNDLATMLIDYQDINAADKAPTDIGLIAFVDNPKACFKRRAWSEKIFIFTVQDSNDLTSLQGFGEYDGEPVLVDTIYMRTADNKLIPWEPSQDDVVAKDWYQLP